MSKIIYIDAGHGGRDPGAVKGTVLEKNLNLSVALAAREYLQAYDCRVVMSRTGDTPTRINDMCAQAKTIGAAAVLSIHHNAGGGIGGEAFYWKGDARARQLAQAIVEEFAALGQVLRTFRGEVPGVKPCSPERYNFGMCRINSRNGIPAILGEFAFIDNATDYAKINTPEKLKAVGIAYAKGVVRFLGLKKKATPKPPVISPVPTPKAGQELQLRSVALYRSSTNKTRANTVTGKYWLYDGLLINGRYRITNRPTRVGKKPIGWNVTGWIDRKDAV